MQTPLAWPRTALATLIACLIAGIQLAAPSPAPADGISTPITVQIVNNSGQLPENVYLLLHNGSSADGKLPAETPVPLSQITNSTFQLGNITAGRLFVSFGGPVTAAEPMTFPVRNDKIEFTIPGKGNLTSVDFFGIPIDVQTLDSGGNVLESLTYRCHTSTIRPALLQIPGATGAEVLTGQSTFSRILSPQISPASYPTMNGYLGFMAGTTITVDSKFFGTPFQTTNYTGTFGLDGSITLNGTITNPALPAGQQTTTGQTLQITGDSMLGGIYSGNGTYTVGGNPAAVSDNDVYSVIYRDTVAGFALGYWGGRYGNSTSQWTGQPPFAAAWDAPPAFTPYYHQYAAAIAEYSDSYGFSFNDVGPAQVQFALDNSQVAGMRVTIDSDDGPSAPGCAGAATPPAPSTPPATPTPPPAADLADVVLKTKRARLDSRGRVLLRLACTGDPCKGEMIVNARRRIRRKLRIVELGRANISIPEGRSQRVWVKLNRTGRILVRRGGRRGLLTTGTVELGPRGKPNRVERRHLRLLPPCRCGR